MRTFRTSLLAAVVALLLAAAPAAACLAMVHEAPVAERHHGGCGGAPESPSFALCADTGSFVPVKELVTAPPVPPVLVASFHPGEAPQPIHDAVTPSGQRPRARSAPIHLLLAAFLI